MSAQSVGDIHLAIVELDGCLFPLNHYRYNFYKNLCAKRKITLTKEEYYNALGNMYTMYDRLPLASEVNSAKLNQKVEKDLFNYLKLKGLSPREGSVELLEYFHQKNIKVAVVSTHKTKNAIAYLQMGSLYHKVDYVIGSDSQLSPLPSGEVLSFLASKYEVEPSQTLLVTSLTPYLQAANNLSMNAIYQEDLIAPTLLEREMSYRTAQSMYETLNDIIFGRYEDYKMYEPVLGMDAVSTHEELKDVHDHLEDVYHDDKNILDIVNRTYEFRLSELNREHPRFTFSDEVVPITAAKELDDDSQFADHSKEIMEEEPTEDVVIETKPPVVLDEEEIEEEIAKEETQEPEAALSLSLEDTAALNDVIGKVMQVEQKITHDEEDEDQDEDTSSTTQNGFAGFLVGLLYTLVLSLMILLGCMVIYVALTDFFESGLLGFLKTGYQAYSQAVNTCVKAILDNLHNLIAGIPSYDMYRLHNANMSLMATDLLNIYIANSLIIGFIQLIKYSVKEEPNA